LTGNNIYIKWFQSITHFQNCIFNNITVTDSSFTSFVLFFTKKSQMMMETCKKYAILHLINANHSTSHTRIMPYSLTRKWKSITVMFTEYFVLTLTHKHTMGANHSYNCIENMHHPFTSIQFICTSDVFVTVLFVMIVQDIFKKKHCSREIFFYTYFVFSNLFYINIVLKFILCISSTKWQLFT